MHDQWEEMMCSWGECWAQTLAALSDYVYRLCVHFISFVNIERRLLQFKISSLSVVPLITHRDDIRLFPLRKLLHFADRQSDLNQGFQPNLRLFPILPLIF